MVEKTKTFVILHHSPLDVLAIMPIGRTVTEDPTAEADVLITKNHVVGKSPLTLWFTGTPSKGFTVLDETKPGEMRTLSTKVLDQLFLGQTEKSTPKKKAATAVKKKVK
jgi:hypothetical protein